MNHEKDALTDLDAALARLSQHDASPGRVALIRGRCVDSLSRPSSRAATLRLPGVVPVGLRLQLGAALALAGTFLAEVAARILAVYLG